MAPAPPVSPTGCRALSEHLWELAHADASVEARPPLEANREERIQGFAGACEADPEVWSARMRACMLDATTVVDARACRGGPPAFCVRDGMGPILLDAATAAERHGTGAEVYADAPTTKERPVEVCGAQGERTWLLEVTCEDGSRPFADDHDAEQARLGNVGPGGRCGSVIDLYEVPCPEGIYEIFMDMYLCAPGEPW